MYQLVIIIAIVLIILCVRHIRQQAPEKRNALTWRYALYGVALLLIALVVTGRMHWVAGAIGAAFPILQRLFPWVMRLLPWAMRKRQEKQTHQNQQKAPTQKATMDKEQALKIFGFNELPDKESIVQRHRELIQKNHPDRGGSDFIAAQINEAKDVLLKDA